jgi:hypothetical protein
MGNHKNKAQIRVKKEYDFRVWTRARLPPVPQRTLNQSVRVFLLYVKYISDLYKNILPVHEIEQ